MVHGNQQRPLVLAQIDQCDAQHGVDGQIKRTQHRGIGQFSHLRLLGCGRQTGQVDPGHRQSLRRLDDLNGLVSGQMVGCAQNLMSRHDLVYCPCERVDIQVADKAQNRREVEGGLLI